MRFFPRRAARVEAERVAEAHAQECRDSWAPEPEAVQDNFLVIDSAVPDGMVFGSGESN